MATREEKKAAKAERQAEKAELRQLEQAQRVEIKELKAAGATKDEIKAEKSSNRTETRTARDILSPDGRQTLLSEGQPVYALTSSVGTYGNAAYADTVQNNINNVVKTYENLGLQGMTSISGKAATGLSFSKVHNAVGTYNPETGTYTGTDPVSKTLNTAQAVYGKTLTQDQLDALGYKVTPVKGQEGLFQIKHKYDTVTGVTFLKKNEDGTYSGVGSTGVTALNVPTGFFTSDLGKLVATVGPIALSLAFPGLGNAVGTALGATGTAATVIGNAAIAGLTTGVITGDVEKALLASAVAAVGTGVIESGAMGDVFDTLGLSDYKSTFNITGGVDTGAVAPGGAFDMGGAAGTDLVTGVTTGGLPSVGTGAFDVGGAEGTGLFDGVSQNVAEGATGAFDIGGATGTNLMDYTNLNTGAFDMGGATGTGILEGTGILGTGLTAKELLSGANTARQLAGLLGLGGGGGAAGLGGGGAGGIGGLGGLDGLLSGLNLGGLAGGAIDYASLQAISNAAREQGQQLAREATQIGTQAQTPFTPYTLTTGAGTATVGPSGATAAAAAPYEALRQQALAQAQQTLGAINPAQATQQFYQNLEALAGPTRQREQEALLSSLGARGLLGIKRNLPTAGGAVRGVNPFQESLLAAQEQGRIQQALQAQQYGTSEAARQQGLAQALQSQAMGIDTQTMNQLAQARQLGLDERSLAQANARLRAETALKGLELRAPYEQLGLLGQIQGINAAAGVGRGLFGLPTQAGNVLGGGVGGSFGSGVGGAIGNIFNSLLNQGMTAEQAADYVNNISSGLDISGESAGTQSLIEQMQEYGIF